METLKNKMLDNADPLARTIPVVTVHTALHLDPDILRLCRRIEVCPIDPTHAIPADCVTWRPSNSIFFTLIKTLTDTFIYCHSNDVIYYTPPNLKLSLRDVKPYTGILCQWCEDATPEGLEPHLLLFDVIAARSDRVETALERGERLRKMSCNIPAPLCVLQWIGFRDALVNYVPKLPHRVDGLLVLSDDPLRPFFTPI